MCQHIVASILVTNKIERYGESGSNSYLLTAVIDQPIATDERLPKKC